MNATPTCRQCSSSQVRDLGAIPRGRSFAGQPLTPAWPGGRLYRCTACHLVFRAPIRDADAYVQQYAAAGSDFWVSDALRTDQALVLEEIRRHRDSGAVLDVGCYDGALLRKLGDSYSRFGIEPSTAASAAAQQSGIAMLGTGVDALQHIGRRFSAISAVDVIEHLPSPLDFLRMAEARLEPGGVLILSTGDSDAPAWRLSGGRFWYCTIPEHLSFISEPWLRTAIQGTSLSLVKVVRFRHADSSQGLRFRAHHLARYGAQALAALHEAALARWWPSRAHPIGPRFHLGVAGLFQDHLLAVLQHSRSRPEG